MGFLDKLLGRNETPQPNTMDDPEAVLPSTNIDSLGTSNLRRSTVAPVGDQLATYRFLVGITTSPAMANRVDPKGKKTPNVGIYSRILKQEASSKRQFKIYQTLISFALGVQLLVAATLTALGASGSNNVQTAVTVFGAINTIIAGFLTYLKGSGLPNRLKYYEMEWKKLREYIEQREREFCHPAVKLDLAKTIETIERMFQGVVADVEANRPETYISINDVRRRPDHSADAAQTDRSESVVFSDKLKGLSSKYGEESKDYAWNLENKTKETVKDGEKYERQVAEEAQGPLSSNPIITTSELRDEEISRAPPTS